MDIVWEGFKYGLLLTVMVGPIFFAIIQTGVEEGFKAGATVGFGIWCSDLLYILFVYFSVAYAAELLQNRTFTLTTGLVGAAILVIIGIGVYKSKAPTFEYKEETQRRSSYFNLFTRGFLINTINPFTIFFWFSVMSTIIVNNTLSGYQAFLFFGTIMGTIILTDLVKAFLAKKISKKLTQKHIAMTRKITGILLVFFGLGILVKVLI